MEFSQILTLIETVSHSSLQEFEMEEEGIRLYMKRNKKGEMVPVMHSTVEAEPQLTQTIPKKQEGESICAPLVGTFYVAPGEGAKPFVQEGDVIQKGQVLGIIEAMKLMNEIESEFEGTILEVLVENEAPVEFGQPLFRVLPK